jgi:hypothetical protein
MTVWQPFISQLPGSPLLLVALESNRQKNVGQKNEGGVSVVQLLFFYPTFFCLNARATYQVDRQSGALRLQGIADTSSYL